MASFFGLLNRKDKVATETRKDASWNNITGGGLR